MSVLTPPLSDSELTSAAEGEDILPAEAERFSLALDTRVAGRPLLEQIPLPADLREATAARRVQFLAGRYCAIRALWRLHPGGPTAIGRAGTGAPIWPSGVVGSITHTEGFVSAAVVRTTAARALGIDSERIVSEEQARTLSAHVSWPSELAHAREVGLDRLQAMTLVFSAKETIFKCLYPLVGVMFYYHDVRIVGVDEANQIFRARVAKTLSPEFPAGTWLEGRFSLSASLIHTGMWLPACR